MNHGKTHGKSKAETGKKLNNHGSSIISESYPYDTGKRLVSYPYDTDKILVSYHDDLISGWYQEQEQDKPSVSLSKRQQQIYDYLILNGLEGSFTKPQIQKSTGIPYVTVRKALDKFINTGIMSVQYDICQKKTNYRINLDVRVERFKKEQHGDHRDIMEYQDHITSLNTYFPGKL